MLVLSGLEKFKTEEDRDKALNSIPDMSDPNVIAEIPSGMTLDDYAKKVEQTAMAALEATIDPEAGKTFEELSGQDQAAAKKPDTKPDAAPGAKQEPAQQLNTPDASQNPTAPPPASNFDKELVERRIANMQSDYEAKLKESSEALEKLKKETEEKLKSLSVEEKKPDIDPNIETQLKAKISKSKEIASKIASADDLMDDEAQRLQKEMITLSAEINDLSYAKTNSIYASAQEKIKAAQEAASNAVKSIEEQREAERKKNEMRLSEEKASKELSDYHKMMDTFKNNNPTFKNTRSYADMERDYVSFSAKLASLYTGGEKLPEDTTPEEREIAYAKFEQKVPALMEKVQESGIAVPEDLSTYAMLSEVGALYGGSEFDHKTGEWKDRLNSRGVKVGFPTVEDAFTSYLAKTGKKEEELIQARRDAVAQYKKATDTRANPVELDSSFQQGAVDDMNEERAIKIMNDESYDTQRMVLIARAGDNAAAADKLILGEYNKALKTLGIPALTEES